VGLLKDDDFENGSLQRCGYSELHLQAKYSWRMELATTEKIDGEELDAGL